MYAEIQIGQRACVYVCVWDRRAPLRAKSRDEILYIYSLSWLTARNNSVIPFNVQLRGTIAPALKLKFSRARSLKIFIGAFMLFEIT